MPYVHTLPIKENILLPIPNIKPSVLPSKAHDVIEFANPVIGINIPAFEIIANLSKTPRQVNINAFKFEKRAQRQLKNVRSFDFDRLTHNRFNLMIFGHSCSPADKDIIYPLLSSPNLRFAIIFCHSTDAKLSIYKNLNDFLFL